jgi:hypothetical protein
MLGQPRFYGAVAVLGGLVLAESLFLPWYSLDISVAGTEAGTSNTAWQAMSGMDVLLFLAAIAAVAGGVLVIRRGELPLIPFAAGAVGVILSAVGLIDLPGSGLAAVPGDSASVGHKLGGFVALVASAGVAFAGVAAGRAGEARPRAAPGGERSRHAAPGGGRGSRRRAAPGR